MTDRKTERLKQAIENGEVIRIIYHGGSQPGTVREITPVSISGKLIWAICMESNRRKQFSIPKIQLLEDGEAAPDRQYAVEPEAPLPDWNDLGAFIMATGDQYAATGMALKAIEDESGRIVGVGVHEMKRDDTPRVHPALKLEYLTTRREPEMDAEGRITYTIKPRVKCWVLSERGKRPQSYSTMQSALRELILRTIGFGPCLSQNLSKRAAV